MAESPELDVLLVWTEGMAWNRGGTLRWELFDRAGRSTGVQGTRPGVPVWSRPTVFVSDGRFTVVY